MTNRSAATVIVTAGMALGAFASIVLAAPPQAGGPAAASESKPWTIARTADGQPDLQGMWTFFDSSPFETPGSPARRRAGETAETAGASEATVATASPAPAAEAPVGDKKYEVEKRPSIVVDPPNGKVPVLSSALEVNYALTDRYYDSYVFQTEGERCIARGVPGGQFPAAYNNAVRILQGPGYVALVYEMVHDARIIPVDGGPHLPQNIRLWAGDSRGHWEGNTLVIDTTNYNNGGTVFQGPSTGYLRGIRQSEALHVVERLTRVSASRISYEVTVDDPKAFPRPWKGAVPLTRSEDYKMYEFACHEGNLYIMTNTLRAGRISDKTMSLPPPDSSYLAAEEAARKKEK